MRPKQCIIKKQTNKQTKWKYSQKHDNEIGQDTINRKHSHAPDTLEQVPAPLTRCIDGLK